MAAMPARSAPPSGGKIAELLSRDRVTIRLNIDRVLANGVG
jgi:hypothetical protein